MYTVEQMQEINRKAGEICAKIDAREASEKAVKRAERKLQRALEAVKSADQELIEARKRLDAAERA